ncbi:MAG: DUF3019 domain-containing protein [Gammaproteobacteria bacterium]|nr:DUF3019 domain-containing protein [Gammaproteobacteria bacterium]
MILRILNSSALLGLWLFVGQFPQASASDGVELTARPAKCISLRKGQVCYQTIRLRWNSSTQGNYCLRVEGMDKPLECWTQQPQGSHRYAFEASTNQVFYLTLVDDDTALASAEVSVAWVYRNRAAGRPSWRLF